MELTSEQKHDISVELNASDIYETVPFLNKVLAAIGYVDRLDDDSEREELRWTKRKEPLIKDEKIRKAVRAWLAIQEQPIVAAAITCNKDSDGFFNYHLYGYIEKARISDGKPVVNNNLTSIDFEFRSLEKIKFDRHHDYTIAELCGEEEE